MSPTTKPTWHGADLTAAQHDYDLAGAPPPGPSLAGVVPQPATITDGWDELLSGLRRLSADLQSVSTGPMTFDLAARAGAALDLAVVLRAQPLDADAQGRADQQAQTIHDLRIALGRFLTGDNYRFRERRRPPAQSWKNCTDHAECIQERRRRAGEPQ